MLIERWRNAKFLQARPTHSLDEEHRAIMTLRRLREILISCYKRQVFGERYGQMQTIQGAQ